MRAFAAVAMAFALLPGVSAYEFDLEPPAGPLQPEVPYEVHGIVTLDCREAASNPGPDATWRAQVNWAANGWPFVLNGPAEIVVDLRPCATSPADPIRGNATWNLTATRAAPGLVPIPLSVKVCRPAGAGQTSVPPACGGTYTFLLRVTGQPRIQVRVTQSTEGLPGIEVTNFGNCDAQVTLRDGDSEIGQFTVGRPGGTKLASRFVALDGPYAKPLSAVPSCVLDPTVVGPEETFQLDAAPKAASSAGALVGLLVAGLSGLRRARREGP